MSKNEKRYFRLFTSAFSNEDKDYLKLFDEIENCEEYDEKQIKNKLGIKHMPFTKKYLFDNILKSSRLYYTEQRQRFQLMDAFKNISILKSKGLIKDAVKIYEKTEDLLIEDNRFTFLLELLNTGEVLYRIYLPNKEVEAKVQELEQKKIHYLRLQRNLTEYQILNRALRNKWRKIYPIRNEEQEKEVWEVLVNPLLESIDNALSPAAQSYYYNNMTIGHSMLLNFEKVKKYAKESVERILSAKQNSAIQRKALMANLCNLMVACSRTLDPEFDKYYEFFVSKMKEFESLDGLKNNIINRKLSYNCKLQNFIEHEQYEEVLKIQEEVEVFWKNYEEFLDNDWKITISDFLAQANFQVNDFDEAKKWVELILEEEKNNPKTPSVCNARILNLLIHFKQENYFLLNSLFRSTYRYLNKNQRLFKSERLLLNYFKWVGEHYTIGDFEEKTQKLFIALEKVVEMNKYEKSFYDELKPSIFKTFQR